eukprot:jgi/Tetstr1/449544/TSEL_036632.t1
MPITHRPAAASTMADQVAAVAAAGRDAMEIDTHVACVIPVEFAKTIRPASRRRMSTSPTSSATAVRIAPGVSVSTIFADIDDFHAKLVACFHSISDMPSESSCVTPLAYASFPTIHACRAGKVPQLGAPALRPAALPVPSAPPQRLRLPLTRRLLRSVPCVAAPNLIIVVTIIVVAIINGQPLGSTVGRPPAVSPVGDVTAAGATLPAYQLLVRHRHDAPSRSPRRLPSTHTGQPRRVSPLPLSPQRTRASSLASS